MVDLNKEKLSGNLAETNREVKQNVEDLASKENTEVSSWIEKIERKLGRVPNKTSDVNDDTVVIQQQAQDDQPPVTLPVTQSQMSAGKSAKIDTGLAWLVAWVIRQMKKLARIGRKVKLMDIPEVERKN